MQGAGACTQAPHLRWFLSTHRLWLVAEQGAAGRERPCQVGVGSGDTLGKPGGLTAHGPPPGAPHSPLTGGREPAPHLRPWPDWASASPLLRSLGPRPEAHLPLLWSPHSSLFQLLSTFLRAMRRPEITHIRTGS